MKIVLKRIVVIFAGVVLFLMLGIFLAGYVLLKPAQLTPVVLRLANQYLDAEVGFDEVDVTIFSTFPSIGVRLVNGSLVKPAADSAMPSRPADTLLLFSSCVISFDPVEFLRTKKIVVHRVQLERPDVYVDVSPAGNLNWNIFRRDTTAVADTLALPELNIRRVRISGATVVYNDRRNSSSITLGQLNLRLGGRLTSDSAQLRLRLDVPSVSVWNNGMQWCDSLPLQFSARLEQENKTHKIRIEQARLSLANMDFGVTGSLDASDTVNNTLGMNIDYTLQASSIPEALAHLPAGFSSALSRFSTAGEVAVQGNLSGAFGANDLPVLRTSLKLSNGQVRSAKYPGRKGIELLEIDGSAYLDFSRKTPSTLQLDKLAVQSPALNIHVTAGAKDLFTAPYLQTAVKGDVDFTQLKKNFPPKDSMDMQGQIHLDISGECFLDNVLNGDWGKIKANGDVDIDSMQVAYPARKLLITVPCLRGRFGSNYKDTSRRRERDILFNGRVSADSITIAMDTLSVRTGKWSAIFSTSPAKDLASIAPVFSSVRLENLVVRKDSLRLQARRMSGTVATRPLKTDPAKPEYLLRFTLDTLRSRAPGFSGSINTGKLRIQAHRRPAATVTRTRSDTASAAAQQRRANRPLSATAAANSDVVNMRMESQEAKTILRQWNIAGSVDIQRARVRTPHFPLRTQIVEGAIDFSIDSVKIKQLQMRLGRSRVNLSGSLRGIRQALLNNRRITAAFEIEADTINLNQMIRALVAGSNYSFQDNRVKDSISGALLDETEEIPLTVQDDTTLAGVFVVPRNIDFTMQAKINKAYYSKLVLDSVNTQFIVRNQAVHAPDVRLHSNIGNMQLAFAYQANNPKNAEIGLDLFLHRIQVKELINAFPLLDSLAPMLRSFEGVVDCHVTGLSKLDAMMNVDFSTATASCSLSGENLTLLDGETFSSIAKTLYFKNKQRNIIDSVSLELILRDNYILIFPFVLSIDRYQVAVGGTQYLDMRFDYHISILKWPVPLLKIGLNLTGIPGDMKIRLAKRLYSDLDDPVKKHSLYGRLFNVRQELEKQLQKDISAIINEAPASRTRRRRTAPAVDDTLRRRFFASDTTGVTAGKDSVDITGS
ncbi:MAG: hypothetical protein LBD87_02900 [Prevotellaceae bacterium]|jgi:hypothetical protein|nr:hypothetical protein [Prevotellaceae bacterium]